MSKLILACGAIIAALALFFATGHTVTGEGGNAAAAEGAGYSPILCRSPARDKTIAVSLAGSGSPSLQWLVDHQNKDGHWSAKDFGKDSIRAKKGAEVTGNVDFDPNAGDAGEEGMDFLVTGLALLAFLGDGHTHKDGAYKGSIRKAARWLLAIQDADGCFPMRQGNSFIQAHAICTMAMAELYAMTEDQRLKAGAQRAVDFIINNSELGFNWKAPEKGARDVEPTPGWVVVALKSASLATLKFDRDGVFKAINARLDIVQGIAVDPDDEAPSEPKPEEASKDKDAPEDNGESEVDAKEESGSGGKSSNGDRNPASLTGIASRDLPEEFTPNPNLPALILTTRLFTNHWKPDSDEARAQADILVSSAPAWQQQKLDYCYWYFGSMALFQMGNDYWNPWRDALIDPILLKRRRGTHEKDVTKFGKDAMDREKAKELPHHKLDEYGSWDPVDAWGSVGGRVYSTAMAVLALEIYHRYERPDPSNKSD